MAHIASSLQRQAQRRVIGKKELDSIIPLSRTTLWRLRRAGLFPAPVRLSGNRIGWFEDEIEEWLASRPREGMA